MQTTTYETALRDLARERFAITPPQPYATATNVVTLVAGLLPASDFASILQAAVEAVDQSTRPNGSISWDFTDYLGRNIHNALGTGPYKLDVSAEITEAWHLLRILPSLVPADDFGTFIRCTQAALKQSDKLVNA
ncbi:hypothetical protein OG689_41250 [Kitasatospora sp. NBC_00240]|uniref:hypothetical protein n=1 Tax=Kitasatospora sp. NBC_00240 TaxID=2903567 RepID=UPI0022525527|nr:hypothetical protein [Kitasatospora sp. NBC_00240]MCX5215583.1 hypothetical protein [Kitasatospora sp. NBC_00240]